MPLAKNLIEAAGNATQANYIEDVFSTYLYTGNSSTQTITNGIDLSTKGGLVLGKIRNVAGGPFQWYDTARGATKVLESSSTAAETTVSTGVTAYNSDGFTIGSNSNVNLSPYLYASWTFRRQPKFFDVVTYTGNGAANRQISHALGSAPGCIIVKNTTDAGTGWIVWHRSINGVSNLYLNTTDSVNTLGFEFLVGTDSSVFTITTAVQALNQSGKSYVAYIFAHDAGGFGLTGTDNVISCGSFTTDASSNATVNLGYEPQWVLIKNSQVAANWVLIDNMRGWANSSAADPKLNPNNSDSEDTTGQNCGHPTATGFTVSQFAASNTHIYIAIRRGPMKVPTDATKVFSPKAYAGTSSAQTQTTNFPVDLMIDSYRSVGGKLVIDRLRGSSASLETQSTAAEDSLANIGLDSNTGVKFLGSQLNGSGTNFIAWLFRRAQSFFDEVCMDGSATTDRAHAHNLGVEPELVICKDRTGGSAYWTVYAKTLGLNKYLVLNNSDAAASYSLWGPTAPTATNIYFQDTAVWAASAGNKGVMYLFATCAGVSKVGSYTGTGTTLQVDCGFAAGARFVLIKKTSGTGSWYVWDSSRGITSGNDPYLLLNSTAAEVTSTDYIDTYSAGFEISSTAPSEINENGGSFIFLAIA